MHDAIFTLAVKSVYFAAGMFWSMLWALILGFALSGMVIAFVPRRHIARTLGHPTARSLALAMFFGAASSSCSYAAAGLSRSLFRKGAHIIPTLAFMLASTNLVIELSAVLWILMGWQFVVAEFLGGILLVFVMSVLMRAFGPLAEFEKRQLGADDEENERTSDPRTWEGWRDAAREFEGEWRMLGRDILLGVAISGLLMAFVPDRFWQSIFGGGALANALLGPVVSFLSFVCSVGNIPLASVLFHGGISFGGTISFIFGDLLILPLILIYRKYYGWKLALWITGVLYASMVVSGLLIEQLFHALDWVPERSTGMAMLMQEGFFRLNYTFWLNLAFLVIGAGLVWLARSGPQRTEEKDCCH